MSEQSINLSAVPEALRNELRGQPEVVDDLTADQLQPADKDKQIAELEAKVRYALATFRALDQYVYEDSDHGILISKAVAALEDK